MILKQFILFFMLSVSILYSDIIDINNNTATNILKYTELHVDNNNEHDFKYILKNNYKLFKKIHMKKFIYLTRKMLYG